MAQPIAFDKTATPNTIGSSDLATLPPVDPELYTVGFEIARGGMGRIFAARDRKLRRDIVIKALLVGGHAPRFEREALITARLQHPSIVRVYDAGQLSGEPFYAMEHVRGKPLDKVVAAAEDPETRLALLPHVIAIADALAYAHTEKGVIHRDLKPANVLVGTFGETVVIDWGLAKDMRADEPDSIDPDRSDQRRATPVGALGSADLTVVGAVMGTPSYRPPEQARGERADERSDVYAIGAILYYVLAGTPPISGATALDDARAGGVAPLRERAPEAPAELVTIVEHAMAFEPSDRYATARELADDLRRYASGKLVARHSYSAGALIRRWFRRHRTSVVIAAAAVVLLGVLSGVWVRGLAAERDEARDETAVVHAILDKAEDASDDLAVHQAERALATDPTLAIAWLQRLSKRGLDRPHASEVASSAAAKGVAFELAGPRGAISQILLAQPVGTAYTASDDGQLFRWQLGAFRSDSLGAHAKAITSLAASPDGFWLATGGGDNEVRIWDLENVQSRAGAKHGGTVRSVAFSPDGNTLASAGDDGVLSLWTVVKGEGRTAFKDPKPLGPIAWNPDGKHLFVATDARFLDLDLTGKATDLRPHAPVRVIAISPSGRTIATGSAEGNVDAWPVADPHPRQVALHARAVRALVWATDDLLVSAGDDGLITVRDLSTNASHELASAIPVVALAATSSLVAAACSDGKVRVWPIAGGPARLLLGHRTPVSAVAFTTNGQKLLSASEDRLRMWPLAPPPPAPHGDALAAWLAARTNLTVAK